MEKSEKKTVIEFDTEGEKPQPKSAKLKGTFFDRDYDGNYRFTVDEDAKGIDQTIIDSWFVAVPELVPVT